MARALLFVALVLAVFAAMASVRRLPCMLGREKGEGERGGRKGREGDCTGRNEAIKQIDGPRKQSPHTLTPCLYSPYTYTGFHDPGSDVASHWWVGWEGGEGGREGRREGGV